MYDEWDERFPILNEYASNIQSIKFSLLNPEELFELRNSGILERWTNFSTEIKNETDSSEEIIL